METYKRVFVIVLDSLGIGAMPDSEKFGDKGVDTFGHILDKMGTLDIPNLQKLGMLNLHKGGTMEGVENPIGRYMRIGETSNGKDTMTGHWEMMGIYTQKPFITFTETGFPKELIDELEKRCGKRVIGNKSASGTEIIEELGEEEINTGAMIVYTSADSVMQICGNEETFDLANLYRCCEIARELTMKDEWRVGRVIARPYVGKKKGANSKNYDLAMSEAAERIEKLQGVAVRVGYRKEDLKTTSFDVQTRYENVKDRQGNYKREFAGYACSYRLKLAFDFDSKQLAKVISAIADCGAQPELSIAFTVKNPARVSEELLINATENARAKAEILCKASGSTLGQLLNIDYNWSELNVFSRTSYDVEDCIQPLMAMSKCAAPEIEPVDIDVTDTVAFTWEIQ